MEASSRKSLFIIIILMKRIFEELHCCLYVCQSFCEEFFPPEIRLIRKYLKSTRDSRVFEEQNVRSNTFS